MPTTKVCGLCCPRLHFIGWAAYGAIPGELLEPESGPDLDESEPYNMLRKARIKVDCVAMLLWRLFWSKIRLTSLCLYLWIDASPQRRGLEFLATSWDAFTVGAFRFRRKLPAIRLQRALFSASGRTTAMLWQIFLLVGPCARTFRIILASIRSITTDMGVESKIYEAADTSIMFLRYLGVAIPRDVQPIQFLLPNCLQIPGWKHKADLWIKRGLSRCRFSLSGWRIARRSSPSFATRT